MHEAMAATLTAVEQIKKFQQDARVRGNLVRPRWPMIVLNYQGLDGAENGRWPAG
jgi:xylulose-5-phosphate/fructose-6-phosphate phosphoketolase